MMNITVNASPESIAKFNEVINKFIKNSTQSMPVVLAIIGRRLAYYAIRSTPIEEETAMMIPPNPWKQPGGNHKYQKAPPDMESMKRTIRGRGFAKSGWARAAQEMGAKASAIANGVPGSEFGGIHASKSGDTATLEFWNSVPYIEDLVKGSVWGNKPKDIMTATVNQARHDIKRQITRWGRDLARQAGFTVNKKI
jgi:hypothetical protein